MAFLLAGTEFVDVDGFSHNVPNGHPGVQAGVGVLKDDLHLPPVGQHIQGGLLACFGVAVPVQHRPALLVLEGAFAAVKDHLTVVDDAAVGGLVQAEHGAAHGGLAAAGFPHQAQGLPLADKEGNVVHRLDIPLVGAMSPGGEVLLEVLYLDEVPLPAHTAFPPSFLASKASFCRSQQWL